MPNGSPSPQRVIDLFHSFHRTAAVKAGVELDVFTAIGAGATTVDQLAARCGSAARGIRILCDYLAVIGLLTKEEDGYALGADAAAFLDRRSRLFFGSAVMSIADETHLQAFALLTEAVRRGGTALPDRGTLTPEHSSWVEFARAMAPVGTVMGRLVAARVPKSGNGRMRVLDLGAGHGLYGIAVAKHLPQAEIVAVDWPNVLAVAREHAEAAGVAERFHCLPGDAFAMDFASEYDAVLMANFLPGLDPGTVERLLVKVHGALRAGGRAITLGPVDAAVDIHLLATTPGGEVYTFPVLDRLFRQAGFADTELYDMAAREQIVVAYL